MNAMSIGWVRTYSLCLVSSSHTVVCDFHLLNACLNCAATKKSINKGVIDQSAQLSGEEEQFLVLPKSSRTQRKVRGEFIVE